MTRSGPRKTSDLSAAEFDVLKTLWEIGPATVREVMGRLHTQGRKVAYTTVLTFLARLEQKGSVAVDRSAAAHVYRARRRRQRVVDQKVKSVVRQLFDGEAAPLVLHLMQNERFSAEQLAELQQLIDELSARADQSPEDAAPRRGGSRRKKSSRTRR